MRISCFIISFIIIIIIIIFNFFGPRKKLKTAYAIYMH